MALRWLARHQRSKRDVSYRRRRGALCLRAALAVPLAVGSVLAGLAPGGITQVAAAGTLDQSQTTTGGGSAAVDHLGIYWAQTFTAGISGSLDQVSLFLFDTGNPRPDGDLIVQIEATTGGKPSGPPLASAAVSPASVQGFPGSWVSVPLSPPAPSTAGTQYAVVISAPSTSCTDTCFYDWVAGLGDPYTRGDPFLSQDGGTTWTASNPLSGSDFAFQTFVTPPRSNPTLATTATPTARVGGKISDAATLSGGATPTGSITFRLFGPNNATCSGTPIFTSTKPVSGDGSYTSGPFKPTKTGTYRWVAGYSGDTNNNPAATACNAPGETSKVTKQTCPDGDGDSDFASGNPSAKDDCD